MKRILAVCLSAAAMVAMPGAAFAQPSPNPHGLHACKSKLVSHGHSKVPFCP
jgi:hypothetical protein